MSYLFNGLHFTSETNTRFLWIILESLDSPDIPDAFKREHQGLDPDGARLMRTAQCKRILCGWERESQNQIGSTREMSCECECNMNKMNHQSPIC